MKFLKKNVMKLFFAILVLLNIVSCESMNNQAGNSSFAPDDVSTRIFTFYKENQEKWSFKVLFTDDVSIKTSSLYFFVDVSEAYYSKTGENTASFNCYFTSYTVIGGNKLGVWSQYKLDLTFLSSNHGKYTGVKLANPEDEKGTPVSGMFVYDSDRAITDFVQLDGNNSENNNGNEGGSNSEVSSSVDGSCLPGSVWIDSDNSYVRYLYFDDESRYRHYFKYQDGVLEETGKFDFNVKNNTIKLYGSSNELKFDFKVLKLSNSEMWLSIFDKFSNSYPESPSLILKAVSKDDQLPSYITEGFVDINISSPSVTDIEDFQAVIKGSILGDNVKFQDRGICYSTESSPTVEDNCVSYNSDIINKSIKNLFSGTTYYVRLYAKIADRYYYGDEISFNTTGERVMKLIFTEILEVSNLKKSYIDLSVKLPNEVDKYGLCYGKSPHPTIVDNVLSEVKRKTSWTLTDIECGYDYYVRAYHIEGTQVKYFDDSEIKISPIDTNKIKYEFKSDIKKYYYDAPYYLTVEMFGFPVGVYEIQPRVWRYVDAYYKDHGGAGKNYDVPKKYVEISNNVNNAKIQFSNKLPVPQSHQMYDEDYRYHLDYFYIKSINNNMKTIKVSFIDEGL